MKKQITLIAGHDTSKARELMTLDWLKEHGVKVEEWNGLQVLTIIGAEMNKGQYTGEYCVGFDNAEGEMQLSALYPGITPKNVQEEVGWPLRLAPKIEGVSAPSAEELRLIREELDPSGMYR